MKTRYRIVFPIAACMVLVGCLTNPNRGLQLVGGAGPKYPPAAQEQGIEGEVEIAYDVTVNGQVENARIVSSTPPGVFDEAALTTVRSWRFNPPYVDGVPQRANDRRSKVEFRIGNDDKYDRY